MSNISTQREIIFRRTIVILLYLSFILMFLSGAFRNIAEWIRAYHRVWGPKIIIILALLHIYSVRKLITAAFTSQFKSSVVKYKYSIILGMILTLTAIITTAFLRKTHIIVRDFHTIYLPALLTILIIMHIFSVLRRKTPTGEVQIRKDYQWVPLPIVSLVIALVVITAITVIILQKIAF